jgi:hypothetical protein
VVGGTYSAYQNKLTRILLTQNSSGQITYYENGSQVYSSAMTFSAPAYGATACVVIGNEPGDGGARQCNTIVASPEIWNVNFSAAMARKDYIEQVQSLPLELNRVSSMLPVFASVTPPPSSGHGPYIPNSNGQGVAPFILPNDSGGSIEFRNPIIHPRALPIIFDPAFVLTRRAA